MAEAEKECHLLVLKKSALEDLLKNFKDVDIMMHAIAKEKRNYHDRLIQEIIRKHKNNNNSLPSNVNTNLNRRDSVF